ncbi:MAG TPA: CotH kinase family protein [Draconibacterium sp.]|nr:CotH kinase family protein [Draconibacterium sp.]
MKKLYFLNVVFFIVFINAAVGQVPGNKLFDNARIHEIQIVPLCENLRDTLETNYLLSFGMNQFQIREIPYTPAKLIVDGTVLDTLGIRYKGFNSWWHSVKKPIKIDINKYKSDQEYDGLKKFNLHNGSGDPSFIRENIDYKILRLLGIKAPRTSFAKVYIDTAYIGLYRIVEQIDNTFLDGNFGNHNGNLYKQQAVGTAGFSLQWLGNKQDAYYKSISLENHENKNDWSDFIHFLDILNNSTDKQFRDSILTVFDVDEYLQVLAFDITVNNIDYYGFSGRNYYLYSNNGVFHWIPWDYNLTWREGAGPLNINPDDFPVLTKRILQVPEFYDVFMYKYCELKPYFSEAFINKLVSGETTAISSYMENDPYQDYPFEAFQKNIDADWMRMPGLKPFAAQRYEDISKVLETLNIDCGTTGNKPIPDENNFQLYPVPATDWINIGQFPNQKVSVSIFNSYGQVVMSAVIFERGKLNISRFTSGCYIVKVDSGERVYSKLILIRH